MSARHETIALIRDVFLRTNVSLSFDDANTLRRAQLTLQRWAELECGDGRGHIERDEKTGIPYYHNDRARYLDPRDPRAWSRIADREKGALRRIAEICQRNGLHYFHQTDPRGCALYVDREPIADNNYLRAVACVA